MSNKHKPEFHVVRFPEPAPWAWSWSPFCGIMYGPIPVGVLVAIPLLMLLGAGN